MHRKINEVETTLVNSAVTVEISLPCGKIPLTPGIIKYPIFVTTRRITEIGPCLQMPL
jgi:hypothetical protein